MKNFKSVYIQNCPQRDLEGKSLKKLFEREKTDCEVIIKQDVVGGSPWSPIKQIYTHAITNDKEAKFILVSQDDLAFPIGVLKAIDHLLTHAPDDSLISFYNPTNNSFTNATNSGRHVYKSKYNYWCQFHAFPVKQLETYLSYCEISFPESYISDDGRMKKWLHETEGLYAYTVIPSLCQHFGAFRSTLNIPGKVGKNLRVSSNFDPSFDVYSINWQDEFANPFITKDPSGFIPYKDYRVGMDLSLWKGKSGEKI